MSQDTWWKIAPIGRDYMSSPRVLDYLVDIVAVRAEHRLYDASEIYAGSVPEERAGDLAIAVSLSIHYKVVFVINSDLLPGGNFTHFYRRDILGSLLANPCDG